MNKPRYILPTLESVDLLYEVQRRMEEATRLFQEALTTEGAHHKQWYLWTIADVLKIDLSGIGEIDKGIAP